MDLNLTINKKTRHLCAGFLLLLLLLLLLLSREQFFLPHGRH